jgi:hypothetical protein
MSQENTHLCLTDDCKNTATHSELDNRMTRCSSHVMDEDTYNKTVDFIRRSKEKHGDKYGYWHVVYTNNTTKIMIECELHGTFEQTPKSHLRGYDCIKCSKDKYKRTCQERYGVDNPFQSDVLKQKIKDTNIQKYGTENPRSLTEIKDKFKKTCLEKYGTEHPMKNAEIHKKTQETILEKYQVENISQSSDIKEKKKQTNLARRQVEYPVQSDDIKNKMKETNLLKYGKENPAQNEDVKERMKKTCIERYGTENSMKCQAIREKATNTNMERYNVKHALQYDEFLNKFKETCIDKFGYPIPSQSPEIKDKIKQTCLKKYGVECSLQNMEVKEKIKKTNLEKYGVENPQQSQEIQEKNQKNAKKFKEYKTPSGAIWKVQGYEPFALNELFKTYTEEQIKCSRKDVPRINYITDDDKQKYYFPDIYIPHENRIIEVKSDWTITLNPDIIQCKKEATIAQGYNYEIWIYDAKGDRINEESIDSDESTDQDTSSI